MSDHRHSWAIESAQDAPDGIHGRKVTMACSGCSETRDTITMRTDDEINAELASYNAEPESD